ncbi:5-formyltetrahydrofolate cyclo-ligase [Enterococcus faecalis 13-SD-W-01]|nr:5-formyltetrahydrofolate cyclo-ligase [Enterococcus faecalis 13-SD-W-01]
MEKEILREKSILSLKSLALEKNKKQKEEQIYQKLFASTIWKNAEVVGITLSGPFELNTHPIIEKAFEEGKKVAAPKTLPQRQMEFFLIEKDSEFTISAFGVKEPPETTHVRPEEIELLIVPGVIYSEKGFRIGFGGGYYDRYLKRYPGKTCSLVFQEQLCEAWEPEVFDIAVQQLFIDGI